MLCDDDCGDNVVYQQPKKRSKILFRPTCKPVTTRIDSNTIYKKSYSNFNLVPRDSFRPVKKVLKFGELDMNTVYNMTYQGTTTSRAQMYRPKPRLKISASPMEWISNHMSSYPHPGVPQKRTSCKKTEKHDCKVTIPMASVTTTKEAYKSFAITPMIDVKNDKLPRRDKWPSNFKPIYETSYGAAYQHYSVKPPENCRPRYQKCPVSSKINSVTSYSISYRPPETFTQIK